MNRPATHSDVPVSLQTWTSIRFLLGRFRAQTGIVIAFILMVIVFSLLSPDFFTPENFINIANQTATTSVLAFGMTMVLLSGGIDLSVGSMASLSGVMCALLMESGVGPLWASLAALLAGATLGFLNGFISVRWSLQSFLVTLGTLSVARGLALILTGGRTIYINSQTFLAVTGQGNVGPVPVLFIWTIVFFAFSWVLMNQTVFGRRVRAVGGNVVAARQAGLRINAIRIKVFVMCGVMAAFTGLMLAGRLSSGLPTVGENLNLDAIAASVLGGTGFNGEGGSLIGTFFGALVLGTVINGLTILGVSSYVQVVIKGVIIILAVLVANLRQNRGE